MSESDDFLNVEDSFRAELREEILDNIIQYERHRPRSLQTSVGPSEAGTPCARRLAFSVTGTRFKGGNQYTEVLPSMRGGALHERMEHVMEYQNELQREELGYDRYDIEGRVEEPVAGTCDLYDRKTFTVVDWKWLGKTTHAKLAKYGPNIDYREQVHLYGLGKQNLGYRVDNVAIMAFNAVGRLRDAVLWMEPFDQQRAERTAARLEDIKKIAEEMNMLEHPYRFNFIPATPGDACFFCPFFNPVADGRNPWECIGTGGNPNKVIETGEL
jgi:hypothetical protein